MKIVGGGLAGLAAAAKLGERGFSVEVHEARRFLGGRAASYPLHPAQADTPTIDNCQHVLLRCCTQLLDFYRRCGVADKIEFHDALHLVCPDGSVDTIRRDPLPAPLHLARSLLTLQCLGWRDKLSVVHCLHAVPRERRRPDLDDLTFSAWLREKRATPLSIQRFWRPFIVSALNEEPDRASALPALQVFGDGLLGSRTSYEVGIPSVPLDELYSAALERRLGPAVRVALGSRVERIDPRSPEADYYISAVPFERVGDLLPGLGLEAELGRFEHSPITGVHLWFDRPITQFKHALLLDRQSQWLFHKGGGYYLVVVSAARELTRRAASEITALVVAELREYFPKAQRAKLLRTRVIKEIRATYSAKPGLEHHRPGPQTRFPNVFLAGDWTATGWPATMEGAVRSGYSAASAVEAACAESTRGRAQ